MTAIFRHLRKANIVTMEVKNFQLETVKERWPEYRKEFSEKLQTVEEYEKTRQDLEIELQGRINSEQ